VEYFLSYRWDKNSGAKRGLCRLVELVTPNGTMGTSETTNIGI